MVWKSYKITHENKYKCDLCDKEDKCRIASEKT